jgi:hypothetical protein
MRKTIRKILLEEFGHQKIEEGLKYLTKIAKKRFPFIESLKLEQTTRFNFYVIVFVNLEKVSDYYKMGIKPYYTRERIEKSNTLFPYALSVLEYGDYRDEKVQNEVYVTYKEILNYLKEVYGHFPKEFKEKSDSHYATDDDYKDFNIEGFKFV